MSSVKKTAKKPFADTAEPKKRGKSKATQADARKREAYGRLLTNADFREFMFEALYTLCAYEPEIRDTTEFERGIRAAGSFVRRTLLVADDAPQFFADLDKRYYAGVRRGIIEAHNKKQGD